MKPGDVYNSTLAMTLQRKLQTDPSFTGLRFSFGAKADEQEHQVDLNLDFFKE